MKNYKKTNMLFEKTHIGKPISEELANYLKDWTTNKDKANACVITDVSMSTIRDLIRRRNPLTIDNSVAIIELMKIAVVNCTNKIEYGKKVKKELEASL